MHLIQQHMIDIECASQNFGKELQNQLSMLLEKEFYPKLELLLQKYDVKNHIWNIDCLSLELPILSKKYWKEEFIEKSLLQIEDYLLRKPVLCIIIFLCSRHHMTFYMVLPFLIRLVFFNLKTFLLQNGYSQTELIEIGKL